MPLAGASSDEAPSNADQTAGHYRNTSPARNTTQPVRRSVRVNYNPLGGSMARNHEDHTSRHGLEHTTSQTSESIGSGHRRHRQASTGVASQRLPTQVDAATQTTVCFFDITGSSSLVRHDLPHCLDPIGRTAARENPPRGHSQPAGHHRNTRPRETKRSRCDGRSVGTTIRCMAQSRRPHTQEWVAHTTSKASESTSSGHRQTSTGIAPQRLPKGRHSDADCHCQYHWSALPRHCLADCLRQVLNY